MVIITGASSGIGRAMALQLAARGAGVVLAARRKDLLAKVAAECRLIGGEALVVPTDISDESQCKALVDRTIKKFKRLDMLVNNAGLTAVSLFEDFPDLELFQHVMGVNFYGAVYCTYYALPFLKESRGRILVISSLGGKAALPYNTPYVSSKFALHGFFESMRMELVRHAVSVTIVCPYWVVSGFHEAQLNKHGKARGTRGRAIYTKKTMTAERCADIALRAAYKGKREVLLGPGYLATWLRLIAPGLVDWIVVNMVLKPAVRRTRQRQGTSRRS